MAKTESHIPKLRFSGFSDAWQKEQLGDLGSFKNGLNKDKDDFGFGIPFVNLMDVFGVHALKSQSFGLVNANVNEIRDYSLSESDVLFIRSSVKPTGVGLTAVILENLENTVYSGFLIRFREFTPTLDKYFKCYCFYNDKFRQRLLAVSTSSANTNVNQQELKLLKLFYPSLQEQTKIGDFFQKIDQVIELQQKALDTVRDYKKAMLQKMFPQKGKKVPQVRFDGFSGDWEGKFLNAVADIIGGGTPDTNIEEYWNGNIDWYAPAEIGKNIFVDDSKRKITELGLRKSSAKILPAYKTILFTSRAGIGDMAILCKDSATNQGFQSLIVNQNSDVYFIYSMGNLIKQDALKIASGSTFLEISGKALGRITQLFPSLEEQQKIGVFFQKLDQQIEQHEKKLESYQSLKKAMLQRMFV